MSGIKDDEVVQTLSADRADEPLGVWILPGAAGRREDFLDLQRSHTRPNVVAINPIPQQIARSVVRSAKVSTIWDSPTQNSRSTEVNVGRFRFRWKATS
jgi:hypothetical protein